MSQTRYVCKCGHFGIEHSLRKFRSSKCNICKCKNIKRDFKVAVKADSNYRMHVILAMIIGATQFILLIESLVTNDDKLFVIILFLFIVQGLFHFLRLDYRYKMILKEKAS